MFVSLSCEQLEDHSENGLCEVLRIVERGQSGWEEMRRARQRRGVGVNRSA